MQTIHTQIEVTRLSELEELSLGFYSSLSFESRKLIIEQLPTSCPKLRALKICK